MSEIVGLIRQFPEGSFFLLVVFICANAWVAVHFINRNKSACKCDCYDETEGELVDTEVEDEDDDCTPKHK